MKRYLYQTYDATLMLLRQTLRQLGLLIAFIVLFPIGFLFFLGAIVQPAERVQVLAGSIMMEMALLNINVVAQSIGSDKQSHTYDLWVSLPMNPSVYVTANALSLLPPTLLSAVITLGVGVVHFGIVLPWTIFPLLLLSFVLVWASTLGIGFLIGVYGSSPRQINQVAQSVGIVMTFFAPVFYPVTILPLALQFVAYLWPITWGSILLSGLLGHGSFPTVLATAVLIIYAGIWFAIISVGIRWRQVRD